MEPSTQEIKSTAASTMSKAKDYARDTANSAMNATGIDPRGVEGRQNREGTVTKSIESVASKIPSGTFLGVAFASIGISAVLHAMGRKDDAHFVGQWVPTILIMGLYNKLVKLEGSE